MSLLLFHCLVCCMCMCCTILDTIYILYLTPLCPPPPSPKFEILELSSHSLKNQTWGSERLNFLPDIFKINSQMRNDSWWVISIKKIFHLIFFFKFTFESILLRWSNEKSMKNVYLHISKGPKEQTFMTSWAEILDVAGWKSCSLCAFSPCWAHAGFSFQLVFLRTLKILWASAASSAESLWTNQGVNFTQFAFNWYCQQ